MPEYLLPGVFVEEADDAGHQRLGDVGHGAVEGEVVQDDQHAGDGLEGIDGGQS